MNLLYVRTKLFEYIGNNFAEFGLLPDSKYTWYSKKQDSNFGKLRCYVAGIKNYSSTEFALIFEFSINEILKMEDTLRTIRGELVQKAPTFTIGSGEFYRGLEGESFKIRSSFYHKVTNEDSLIEECELCKNIFMNDIASKIPIFTNLKNFQNYLISNEFIIQSPKIILPGLLALKLLGAEYFESFAKQVANYFDFENNKQHYVIEYVDQIRSL